jgi:hypothetical protein
MACTNSILPASIRQPRPSSPVYPTVPRWRQIFLFYLPARLTALLPQLLFYLLISTIVWGLASQIRKPDSDLLIGIISFFPYLLMIHDWAVRAERKRNKRGAIQTLFLTYRQPTKSAQVVWAIFYFAVFALIGLIGFEFKYPVANEDHNRMIWSSIVLWVALHDYARSFDVVPQESTPTQERN